MLVHVGARQVPHSGRTLLDHLRGTYELLTQWECNEATCVAGLFHSIYGTQTFAHSLLDHSQRGYVRSLIGVAAEQLVYFFSTTDRNKYFDNIGASDVMLLNTIDGELVEVPSATLNALVAIEVANTVEQIPHKPRISRGVMEVYTRQCEAAKAVIPDEAFRQCVRVFAHHRSEAGLGDQQF